jgi:hypothetical protein
MALFHSLAARKSSALGVSQELILHRAEELTCVNMMCPKLGDACLCKLAAAMQRLKQLRLVDLSSNRIFHLPESMLMPEQNPGLEHVDLADNHLTELPDSLWHLPLKVCLWPRLPV